MPTTSNFGWTTPADTDLVKDGAAAIRTLGNGIDTSFLDLKGGTTGQVLAKASNTDLDFSWVAQDDSNAIQNALLTTTGDTIYASAASTPSRLGIGTTGQVLTVSGGVPAWATPASGGMTSIASGSLSGASVSLTSIAGTYKDLVLVVRDFYFAASAQFRLQINSNTGSVYWNAVIENDHTNATSTTSVGLQTSFIRLSASLSVIDADNNNISVIKINDYANTSSNKLIEVNSSFISSGSNRLNTPNSATFNNTTAISSIQIFPDGTTFSGGTYILYGVS